MIPLDPNNRRIRLYGALEVNVAALCDGEGVYGLPEFQLHDGGVWKNV